MITKLSVAIDNKWVDLPVYNRVEFDERLDERLDSGNVQTINDNSAAYEDYSLYRVTTSDPEGNEKEIVMFGFDTVTRRGIGYYIHTIELVEPTRLVMGFTIDGFKVTQPIEGEKKSLYDIVFSYNGGLISKARLESVDDRELYLNYGGGDMIDVMKNIPSPEFHWECGTLLWECLCDIGNVINCIPRISFVEKHTKYMFIDFDPINDITAEYDL